MRFKRLKIPAILAPALVIAALVTAFGDWRSQPFGSIISVNPLTLPPTYSWSDSCSKATNAPTLLWGNSPETWTKSSWTDPVSKLAQDHIILSQGTLSPPGGLIAFHYVNSLPTPAPPATPTPAVLYIGIDPTSVATYGTPYGAVSISTAPPYLVGAQATTQFLQKYVPNMVRPSATPLIATRPALSVAPTLSIAPKPILHWSVPNGSKVSGEVAVPKLSLTAFFYVFACTAHCTALYTSSGIPDTSHQRGYFPGATFNIHYDYTPAYAYPPVPGYTPGGSAFEIVGKTGCVPNLAGTDLLDPTPGPFATLVGDYAVPVDMYGAAFKIQRFGVNPRGGFPYEGAMWVQQLISPATQTTVSPAAYQLPTPQATPTFGILNNGQSIFLGEDQGKGHQVIYVLPGGNSAPVWFWDYVITPPP